MPQRAVFTADVMWFSTARITVAIILKLYLSPSVALPLVFTSEINLYSIFKINKR